jgi:uncharacterized protein
MLGSMNSDKKLRWIELLLVVAVAFSGPFLASSFVVLGGSLESGKGSMALKLGTAITSEVLALCVLAHVLYRQGRSLRDLGASFARSDLVASLSLAVWSFVAFYTTYLGAALAYVTLTGHRVSSQPSSMLGGGLSVATLALVVVNPVFEELIARAFVISELQALAGSPAVAAAASVILQTAYHLYQGPPQAVALAASFAVFSLYYLSTRRVWPIVLAHFYLDLFALMQYSR